MKILGVIPARYASTRFPGKPLALLGGTTVIERVYRQVADVFDEVVVATDDIRIRAAVEAFGGKVVMTSTEHRSGTDRCYEALCHVSQQPWSIADTPDDKQGRTYPFDVVVNIQGDEPFIHESQLLTVRDCFADASVDIATLVKPFTPDSGFAALENANSPKVVVNSHMEALYFSRSIIPYMRGKKHDEWLAGHTYYKHIGLYAYRSAVLAEITSLPQSSLEKAESLEQLRWLENGYKIKVGTTDVETIGIDTPDDLARAEEYLSKLR